MSYIAEVFARQILDSRGNPTVEVDIITDEDVLAGQLFPVVPAQVFMKQ